MIENYELEDLDLRIEVFVGKFGIEDIYDAAKSYFDNPLYKKVNYTIIDFREADLSSITVSQVKEYSLWQKNNPKYQRSSNYIYLNHIPKSTALSVLYHKEFEAFSADNIYYTVEAALNYLGLSEHAEEIKKYLKDDRFFISLHDTSSKAIDNRGKKTC